MKRIKSFKLFESVDPAMAEKVCSLYEDVRSIGYILEEEGFEPEYKITVVCVPDGTLQKEVRTIRVENSDDIRRFLRRWSFNFLSSVVSMQLRCFTITIKNANPRNLPHIESIDFFREEVDSYLAILKEHLDYVPEEHIKKQLWHSAGQHYDISVSSDFFAL